MRLPSSKASLSQRSINLAVSSRGIAALHAVNPQMATTFLASAIPMKGRMLHHDNGRLESQLYDPHGQVCLPPIYSLFPYASFSHLYSSLVSINSALTRLTAGFSTSNSLKRPLVPRTYEYFLTTSLPQSILLQRKLCLLGLRRGVTV